MSTLQSFLIKRSSLQARGARLAEEMAKRIMPRENVISFFNKINPDLGRKAAETLTEKSYVIPRLGLRTPGAHSDALFMDGLENGATLADYLNSAKKALDDPSYKMKRALGTKDNWLGKRMRHSLAEDLVSARRMNKGYKKYFYNNLLRDLQFTPVTPDMQRAFSAGEVSDDLFRQAALADMLRFHNTGSGTISTTADMLHIPQFMRKYYGKLVQDVNLMPAGSKRAQWGKKLGDWLAEKAPSLEDSTAVATLQGRNAFYTPFGDVIVSSMDNVSTEHEKAHKLLANLYDRDPQKAVDMYRTALGRLHGAQKQHNLNIPWDKYRIMHEGVTDFTRTSLNPLRQDRAWINRPASVDVDSLKLNDMPLEEALNQIQINYATNIAPSSLNKAL